MKSSGYSGKLHLALLKPCFLDCTHKSWCSLGSFEATWLQENNFLVIAHSFFCHFKHLWCFLYDKNWISSLLLLSRLKERSFVTFYVSFYKRKCPLSSPEEHLTPYRELALCVSRRLPFLAREENLFCYTCYMVCSFMGSWHTESLIFARYWVPSARYWVPSYPLQPKRSWLLLASVISGPRRPQVVFTNYLCAFACQRLSELIFIAYERFEALMTLACH